MSFPRSSPYWPVLSHPLLRRVLPAMAVSALGDGMSLVAISWLALQLAPPGRRGTWVALAVAAYSLPAMLGAAVLGRFLIRRDSTDLVRWDATLRGIALGLIPIGYLTGLLTPPVFVTLLAVSSLLHSWGSAGQFTLIAEVLPAPDHVPANALLTIFAEAATIAGPPLAGLLIAGPGAPAVIAIDAASFLLLAATYRLATHATLPTCTDPATRAGLGRRGRSADDVGVAGAAELGDRRADAGAGSGLRAIVRDRTMFGLLAMTFFFFLFFGPVYVALPIHVAGDLHGSAALLGVFYTAFGVGSLAGAIAGGYAGRLPLWPTTIAIVGGFGLTLLPFGLGAPIPVTLVSFAVGGVIWGPYMSMTRALFQRQATGDRLPGVLAALSTVIVAAVPLGTIAAGPLVSAVGARHTILASGLATVALAVVAIAVVAAGRPAKPGAPPPGPPGRSPGTPRPPGRSPRSPGPPGRPSTPPGDRPDQPPDDGRGRSLGRRSQPVPDQALSRGFLGVGEHPVRP